MSLVKSPRLTPEKLKANRRNGRQAKGLKARSHKLFESGSQHVAAPA